MIRHNLRLSSCVALATLLFPACAPRGSQKEFESISPTIPASRFRTIATIASSGSRMDLAMSVQARLALQKEGFNAVRASGRWDAVPEMVSQLCSPSAEQPVDGVLLVSYNHLTLYDCQSTKAAYELQSSPESGGLGFQQSVTHLIKYLKSGRPVSTP